jgi:hypothetical protein
VSISTTERNVGHGKITYVNIQPVPSNYLKNLPGNLVYNLLGQLSHIIEGTSNNSQPPIGFRDVAAIFREMTGKGNIEVNTTSVIFPSDSEVNEWRITTNGENKTLSISNVTKLNANGYYFAVLRTSHSTGNNISLTNGRGLYADLTLGNGIVDLSFLGKGSTTITGSTRTGGISSDKSFHLDNVRNLSIMTKEPIHIFLRQPIIKIKNGNITFKELHTKPFYKEASALGYNLRIIGNVFFTVFMSDSYTLTSDFSATNYTQWLPPHPIYNDFAHSLSSYSSLSKHYSSLLVAIGLLSVPFLIATIFLVFGRPKQMKQKTT